MGEKGPLVFLLIIDRVVGGIPYQGFFAVFGRLLARISTQIIIFTP